MSNDRWRTPNWLYKWLDDQYGPFDIDLAADHANTKCERYYSLAENALAQDWSLYACNGFCNPPYSDIAPWLLKAQNESQHFGFKSTWVLPVWNGEIYWRLSVFEYAASEYTKIFGRIAFIDDNGNFVNGNRGGTVIVHYNGSPQPPAIVTLKLAIRDTLIPQYSK